jgi:hypothetical protein
MRLEQSREDSRAETVPQVRLALELAIDLGPERKRPLPSLAGEGVEWDEALALFPPEAIVDRTTELGRLFETAARDGGVQRAGEDGPVREQIELPFVRGSGRILGKDRWCGVIRRFVLRSRSRAAREERELCVGRRRGDGITPRPAEGRR